MKTLRMFKGELCWFTELGARIAANDLLNDMRSCINELNKLRSQSTLKDAVTIANKYGLKLDIKLRPKPTTKKVRRK